MRVVTVCMYKCVNVCIKYFCMYVSACCIYVCIQVMELVQVALEFVPPSVVAMTNLTSCL